MAIGEHKNQIDTPALLLNLNVLESNLSWAMKLANKNKVKLRPHTKTHRTPAIALKQLDLGSSGITVAKVGEAEVMAANGITDIFIANEIAGEHKLNRLKNLAAKAKLAIGIDHTDHLAILSKHFAELPAEIDVLIDVETGDRRTGVLPDQVLYLAEKTLLTKGVNFKGLFTHEGHTYGAADRQQLNDFFIRSQELILKAAEKLTENGIPVPEVSIGATPSILVSDEILPGITEIRPGTYALMDAAQGAVINDFSRCALSVLATVVNKPTADRIVLDSGVKALSAFIRNGGVTTTPGYGIVKGFEDLRISSLSDEHGIIYSKAASSRLSIGDKLEIIPNHACPTCNLYQKMYVLQNEIIVDEWPILAQGKSQ